MEKENWNTKKEKKNGVNNIPKEMGILSPNQRARDEKDIGLHFDNLYNENEDRAGSRINEATGEEIDNSTDPHPSEIYKELVEDDHFKVDAWREFLEGNIENIEKTDSPEEKEILLTLLEEDIELTDKIDDPELKERLLIWNKKNIESIKGEKYPKLRNWTEENIDRIQ